MKEVDLSIPVIDIPKSESISNAVTQSPEKLSSTYGKKSEPIEKQSDTASKKSEKAILS